MAGGQEKWYFIKDQLQNSPSRKCGLDADKELAYRQQAANLIQDMGQRLQVSQLCINTAIVYMHRFYAFHSFTQFHRNAIAAAALFLAAKVEEQPRKLEYVIKVAHVCLHRGEGVNALTSSEQYQEQAQDLVFNENVLLQTLGFDVAIDHPHTHVLQTCHLVKAPKDLAQTSYFMASNSLHLTTMCLQYKPTVVACFCIHLASKWSNWQIPQSHEGRHWFSYVDRTVTTDLLERLTAEFLHIFDKCPSRLKKKMMTMSNASGSSPNAPHPSNSAVASPYDRKKESHSLANSDEIDKSFDKEYERERRRQQAPGGYVPATAQPNQPQPQKIDFNLYREKREREERERRQQALQRPGNPPPSSRPTNQPPPNHHHHRPPNQHKAHHSWPHKPPHHKPPHERHRPIPPSQSQAQSQSQTQPPSQPPAQSQPPQEIPQRTRPPSLFSPENVTPAATAAHPRRPHPPQPNPPPKPKPPQESRPPIPPQTDNQKPPSPKKRPDAASAVREMQPPAILSPFSSPKEKRQRLPSNSEPELVPVVKKIDETPGYENIVRDSQRGNAIKTHQSYQRPEIRKPEGRTLNGIETDPTLVSNLLKESLAKPAPITVATEKKSPLEIKKEPVIEISKPEPEPHNNVSQQNPPTEDSHKHKKDKKKKDKHKHKDRDKSKDERKKHKKDKDKKKEPSPQQESDGLKITIPREKLSASPGLKIKIPKERLAAPPPPPQQQQQLPQTSGLKIKISKDVLENSRKRTNMDGGPPQKMARPELPKVAETLGNGHPGK